VRRKKLKVVVALTKKCQDFDAFCEVVCSSSKIKKKVDLVFSENKEHLRKIISDADILVCMKIDREAFAKAKNLKWVHLGLAGVDKALLPELVKSQVKLTSSKGIHATTLAELVLGMILAFAKGIVSSMSFKNRNVWGFEQVIQSRFDLEGKVLGIIGLGLIGIEVAKKAKDFGMRVIAVKNRPGRAPRHVDEIYAKWELNQVLKQSDFVFLSVPLTKETYHLIGQKELDQMKKTAFLINTARGPVVDENALIDALKERKIAGAGLDVFEKEPLPESSELWNLENVIITPHVGGAMPDYYRKVGEVFKENLEKFLQGKRLKNLVNRKLGY
jgi:phosphoglycerate dehydrogenase-like enzyme